MAAGLDVADVQRYARHIALPEIGPDGQRRLGAARVAIAGADLCAETAARYLAAAGIGTLRLIGAPDDIDPALRASNPHVALEHQAWPAGGVAWVAALDGVTVVVRSGFDDDAMVDAAARRGVPAVVARGKAEVVDLLSFANRVPSTRDTVEVPPRPAEPSAGAPAVVAGTLAAAEAIRALLGMGPDSGARHLRLPLDGGAPVVQDFAWGSTGSARRDPSRGVRDPVRVPDHDDESMKR